MHQRSMQHNKNCNNGRTLFGIRHMPTDPQIRNILNEAGWHQLAPAFSGMITLLRENQELDSYRVLDGQLLICLEGTESIQLRLDTGLRCSEEPSSESRREMSIRQGKNGSFSRANTRKASMCSQR